MINNIIHINDNYNIFAAGILVGIGDIVYMVSGNIYIGAMLFSLALLTIINSNLYLYTGKIGFLFEKTVKPTIWSLAKILAMNLLGVCFSFIMFYASNDVYNLIIQIARDKFACSWLDLYCRGFLCGICMYIAVSNKHEIITVFSVMTFILCGFRHCIADFPFLIFNFSYENLFKFIMIILGNSLGAIIMRDFCNPKQKKYFKEKS